MKIVIFTTDEPMLIKTSFGMKEIWEKAGHEVLPFFLKERKHAENLFKIRHFQMYEEVLNYAEEVNADLLYFDGSMNAPEFLLAELEVRPSYRPKISFFFVYREISRSPARANVMSKLINMPQIKITYLESPIGNDIRPPETWPKSNLDSDKIKIVPDRFFIGGEELIKDKIISRNILEIDHNKFIFFFLGRMVHSKGLDIAVEAMKHLNDDYLLLVKARSKDLDYNYDIKELSNLRNIKFIDGIIPDSELGYYYSASDCVILPYRNSYNYGSSAIPFQAASIKKPCIISDVYPLNEVVKKFKIGLISKVEDSVSLASQMINMQENYKEIISEAKFEECANSLTTIKQMAEIAIS